MILSFAHRFLFVAIPKTASQAVRLALRPHLAPGDWEQHMLLGQKTIPVPQIAALGHGHVSAAQIRPFIRPERWPHLHKFAFVRDPVDRFLSYSWFIHRQSDLMQRDPLGTMKAMLSTPEWRAKIMLRPQHEFICDAGGEVMVDFVGRYETLQADFASIGARLKLPIGLLESVNAGPRPVGEIPLDAELTAMLSEVYAADFRLFDYPVAGAA